MTATATAATTRTEYADKSLAFNVNDLRERVRQCSIIIPRKVAGVEYAAVRITATDNRVTMFAACTGRQVLADVRSGAASEDMVLAVNAADLAAALKTAPKASTVTLDVYTDTVTVTTDTATVTLPLIDWRNIPAEPVTVDAKVYSIAAADLIPAIKRVLPMAGAGNSRYVMDGVNFDADHDTGALYLEATNGRHLAAVRCEYRTAERGPTVAIMSDDCKALVKLKTPKCDDVRIVSDDNVAAFTADGVTLTVLVPAGTFPDAWSVIPEPTTNVVTVSGDVLAAACYQARTLAPVNLKADKRAKMYLDVTDGAVSLVVVGYDIVPEANDRGDVVDMTRERAPVTLALDGATYVGDVPHVKLPTTAIGDVVKGCDFVRVYLDTPRRPVQLVGDSLTYVVMPISA